MDGMKKCSKCGEPYPNTLEYFHSNGHGTGRLRARCKNCDKAARRMPPLAPVPEHDRPCALCGAERDYREFTPRLYNGVWRFSRVCRLCRNFQAAIVRSKSPANRRAQAREYYWSHREIALARQRKYYQSRSKELCERKRRQRMEKARRNNGA